MTLLRASFLSSPGFLGLLCFCLVTSLSAVEDENALRLYQRGIKLVAEGELEEALDRFNTVATKYRRSKTCAEALWEIYRIQVSLEDHAGAFEALNRLVTEQPGHFEKAHAAQFQLALRLLGAGKDSRRSLERPAAKDKVEPTVLAEMLRVVIKNGPESETGIQALYYLALAQEKVGEKDEAFALHQDFAEKHPTHELADDAGYQSAYIAYKNWKAMRSNGPHQREAAAVALSWFIARFPESDKAAQARACLAEVSLSEQRELIHLARYYEERGNTAAAAVYYQQLALKFPDVVSADSPMREKVAKALEQPGAEKVGPAR